MLCRVALFVQSGSAMRLNVLAHLRQHSVIQADVLQIGDCDVRKEGQHPSQRGKGISDERQTQMIVSCPSLVLRNPFDDGVWQVFSAEHFEQLAFGQVRVAEGGVDDCQVGINQKL